MNPTPWEPDPTPVNPRANVPINLPGAPRIPETYESDAAENAALVRNADGVLLSLSGFSNLGSAQYIMVFDSNTQPGNGAVPKRIKKVAATDTFEVDFGRGVRVENGIWVCNSTTAPTLTLGAADCLFHATHDRLW